MTRRLTGAAEARVSETEIPARLDRLPWARWHWMVLIGLGCEAVGAPQLPLSGRE